MKEKVIRLNLYIGLFVLISSGILIILQVSFIKAWFFSFAWWSFILVVDSLNFRKTKTSPLFDSFKNFLFTVFISVFVWLIFELFNLRLRNWTYHNLPANLPERWLGYFISFATVIPAMREIALFVESFFRKKKLALFEIRRTAVFLKICVFLGGLFILLTLARPRIFFPFAWLCFIFLIEPLNYWMKNETFLKRMEKKEWARFWSWLLAGLIAGFFWEFWNFWAGSHWEYSLPFLDFWKVFQMPVLGYTGFLPFALEIFVLYQFLFSLYRKIQRKIFLKNLIFILLLLFYAGVFYLIDTYTLIR